MILVWGLGFRVESSEFTPSFLVDSMKSPIYLGCLFPAGSLKFNSVSSHMSATLCSGFTRFSQFL